MTSKQIHDRRRNTPALVSAGLIFQITIGALISACAFLFGTWMLDIKAQIMNLNSTVTEVRLQSARWESRTAWLVENHTTRLVKLESKLGI